MHPLLRIVGISAVFGVTSIGWLILGGVTTDRTHAQLGKLGGEVNELWGRPHVQAAPALAFTWRTERLEEKKERDDKGREKTIQQVVWDPHTSDVNPASTRVDVSLALDQRLKGLMWYSLYGVAFEGVWTYVHKEPQRGTLFITFQFPDPQGVYDGFHFFVAGRDRSSELRAVDGKMVASIDVSPGDELAYSIGYKSRGMDEWRYVPAAGVASLKDFQLTMATDFVDIDFPQGTMSPSSKARSGGGWRLDWNFKQVVTGHNIGVSAPARIQPGELAASLAFSAPISLLFFFLVIFVLTTLKKIEIHPINYMFLGAAFFAFHLLFAYSVDHLHLIPAFVLSSVVSILLVMTYLRLVAGARFAFVEAALAQLLYLVGFSVAHFFEGFTGLSVTVLSIATLFLLMQLTGRIRWADVTRSH
jgi:inner membrane protein CreD